MRNGTGRARHLTLVPDLPTEPSRPRPRRYDAAEEASTSGYSDIVQLTMDVHLAIEGPTVWRRIRVRSDLLLPELHTILQAAIGWDGQDQYTMTHGEGSAAHTYCAPKVLAAGEAGQLGDHVRVDSLLSSPGDTLHYRYQDWVHTVCVHSVDTDIDDLRPTCLDGAEECPIGDGVDGPIAYPHKQSDTRSTPVADANLRLRCASTSRSTEVESAAASPVIARFLRRVLGAPVPRLIELLPRCELTIESSVDLPVARTAMAKVSWFLQIVGDRGVQLTDDGHLPPSVVEPLRDQLDWGIGWVGTSVREADHHQATDLREAARNMGLVRVLKGTMVRTKAGSLLADDSRALWHHCAARLPLGRQDHEQHSGTLYLVALAASASAAQRDEMVVESMQALGWGGGGDDAFEAQKAAHPTVAFLDLIGAHGPLFYLGDGGSDSPGWARRFARDALRTQKPL